MGQDFSNYTFNELREMYSAINREMELRKHRLRDELFNAMMKAIHDFQEVCPYARVSDYEESISITEIADRDNWEFGE